MGNNFQSFIEVCTNIEDLLYKCLFFEKICDGNIFSMCFGTRNKENISEKNVKKLEKNGILFYNNTLFLDNIEKVNITKFKKNLSLNKYCEEKTQNNLKNDNNLKDIFIYFRD